MLELFTLNLRDDVREANARGKMQNTECKTRGGLDQRKWKLGLPESRGKAAGMGSTCSAWRIRSIGNQDEPL